LLAIAGRSSDPHSIAIALVSEGMHHVLLRDTRMTLAAAVTSSACKELDASGENLQVTEQGRCVALKMSNASIRESWRLLNSGNGYRKIKSQPLARCIYADVLRQAGVRTGPALVENRIRTPSFMV
jgi:hypothetical protein